MDIFFEDNKNQIDNQSLSDLFKIKKGELVAKFE